MESIKLISGTSEFFMSRDTGVFELVDGYLGDQDYRTLLKADETEEFRIYPEAKLDMLFDAFKESSRLKLSRIKRLVYRGKDFELNLSDNDHFLIYSLHEIVCALARTKGLEIEYNSKA